MGFTPSNSIADSEYLLGRAMNEARLALEASNPASEQAHQKIADHYLAILFGDHGMIEDPAAHDPKAAETLLVCIQAAFGESVVPNDREWTNLLQRLEQAINGRSTAPIDP